MQNILSPQPSPAAQRPHQNSVCNCCSAKSYAPGALGVTAKPAQSAQAQDSVMNPVCQNCWLSTAPQGTHV